MLETLNISWLFLSILFGVFGWTFVNVYTQSDMIFEKYYTWISKLPTWLAKPLGTCDLCFAGQVSLWGNLVFLWGYYPIFPLKTFVIHILYISLSVITVRFINERT